MSNETLVLTHIGIDGWERMVYRDQHGKMWKDIDVFPSAFMPSLHSSTNNELDGEPDWPLKQPYVILKNTEVEQFRQTLLEDDEFTADDVDSHIERLRAGNRLAMSDFTDWQKQKEGATR